MKKLYFRRSKRIKRGKYAQEKLYKQKKKKFCKKNPPIHHFDLFLFNIN